MAAEPKKGGGMKETADKLKELLENADFRYGHEVFLTAYGRYVNSRGDLIDPYTILVKIGGLTDAVKRGRDLLSVMMAIAEKEDMERKQNAENPPCK